MSLKKLSAFQEIVGLSKEYSIDIENDPFFKTFASKLQKENGSNFVKLFLSIFPDLSQNFLIKLGKAADYYLFSLLITDNILDNKSALVSKNSLILSFLLRERALHLMYQLFDHNSIYWEYFDTHYKEYVYSFQLEGKYRFDEIQEMSIKEMEAIYTGKSAMAKAVSSALAIKSGQTQHIPVLEKSIENFYIAKTLKDDVNDWKEDFKNKQYTYILSNVIVKNNLNVSTLTLELLGKYVFFTREAEQILELALEYYKKALEIVTPDQYITWKGKISHDIQTTLNLKEDIKMLVNKELKIIGFINNEKQGHLPWVEVNLPFKESEFSKMLKHAFHYILENWRNGFDEVSSYSYFPNVDGFSFEQRYGIGDTFQRAIICDLFQDCNQFVNNSIYPYLKSETDYLIKQQSLLGGWNFYTNMDVQPCDADTTFQVIKVLLKQGQAEKISKTSIDLIDNWLGQHFSPDGYICSWLIPPANKCNIKQQQQRDFLMKYTNHDIYSSIDIEVLANIYNGLYELDAVKYKAYISNGLEYIEKNQNTDGCWNSTWYFGPFYATYMCATLISRLSPNSGSLIKAYSYIEKSQNIDGGWGWEPKISDPLNTALALLCLYINNANIKQEIFSRAFIYLNQTMYDSEKLKKCRFINYRKKGLSYFKSNCVTYAYILKAILLWKTRTGI